jgi:glycerol-3-phosphate dehydrogenase (NAD(P)+)
MHEAKQPQPITVLGAGAWGTAVAIALAARHDVLLWGRNPEQMAATEAARDNVTYLPGHPLPPSLRVTADFEAAIAHVTGAAPGATPLLIAACPVAGLRPLLETLKGYPIPNIVWLCKGFEYGTGLLPHQVVRSAG